MLFSHDAVQENTVENFLDDTRLRLSPCADYCSMSSVHFVYSTNFFELWYVQQLCVCVCVFFLIFHTGRVYTFRVQHVNTFIQVFPTTRHTLTRATELWNSVKNQPVNQLFSQVILHFTHVLCMAEPDGGAGRCPSDARGFLPHLHRMTCKIRQKSQRRRD